MTIWLKKGFIAASMTALWLYAAAGVVAQAADVSVNINLPGPVVRLPAPPHMVWLPAPRIYIAFESPQEIFFDDDHYYLHDHDVWYAGPGYGGPWARVKVRHLPPGLRKYRHEQWDDFQHQAQPRYRDDDDNEHRNFVGWKEKKYKQEKNHGRDHEENEHSERGRGHGQERKHDREDD